MVVNGLRKKIARLGREECEELDAILIGWDGRFSPILRKRVARHIDACDVCTERKAAVASPLALLAAAPLVPAPAELRSRVLDGIAGDAEPAQPISFTRDGFAAAEPTPIRRRPRWLVGVAAALLLLGGLATALAMSGDDDDQTQLAAVEGSTSTSEEPTATTDTTQPILMLPPTTTTTPEVAPPTVEPEGPTTTKAPVVIPPPPPPPPDTTPPVISSVTQSASTLSTASCDNGLPKVVNVSANVSDASPVTASVSWSGPPGSGSTAMTGSGSTYSASFGNFPVGGDLTYRITATDAAGSTTTTSPRTVTVNPCPG